MSSTDDPIARFTKMATDDPDNELAHYRLGQLLLEAKQYDGAIASFRRTLELSPQFSKVYSLLAQTYNAQGNRDEALRTAEAGFKIALERGDNMPREEMARLITDLGGTVPVVTPTTPLQLGGTTPSREAGGGFRCERPTCAYGAQARQLPKPPTADEDGRRIHASVCAGCWNDWLRNFSIKVINELRLDLSTDRGQAEYDKYMREFFGLEQPAG